MKTTEHIFRKWKYDDNGAIVWAMDDNGNTICKIADIRGWGYLTGKSDALGLSDLEAEAVEDKMGNLIAAAPDLLEALKFVVDQLESPEVEVVRDAIAKAKEEVC